MKRPPWKANVTRKTYMKLVNKMVGYYEYKIPFDEDALMRDTYRMEKPFNVYRVLCSSAYLGINTFVDGVITSDILKATGWKMPSKATALQIQEDKEKSKKIEAKCAPYVDQNAIRTLIKERKFTLPVEWRAFYCLYVPKTIFTPEEIFFMENNPQWLLYLEDNPTEFIK